MAQNKPIANCDRFKTQLEVPIWQLKFSNFPAPKPVIGDSVNRSQFVTGWLPESRSHFATLNNGEKWLDARPHPGVDSLAPARSALRAFGFAEFLSPIPNRFKSPPRRRRIIRRVFGMSCDWIGRTIFRQPEILRRHVLSLAGTIQMNCFFHGTNDGLNLGPFNCIAVKRWQQIVEFFDEFYPPMPLFSATNCEF